MTEMVERFQNLQAGIKTFGEEMREKGIHVGMGVPPYCVNCGGEWPCEPSKAALEGMVRND